MVCTIEYWSVKCAGLVGEIDKDIMFLQATQAEWQKKISFCWGSKKYKQNSTLASTLLLLGIINLQGSFFSWVMSQVDKKAHSSAYIVEEHLLERAGVLFVFISTYINLYSTLKPQTNKSKSSCPRYENWLNKYTRFFHFCFHFFNVFQACNTFCRNIWDRKVFCSL